MKPAKIFTGLVIALMLLQTALALEGNIASTVDYSETRLTGTTTEPAFTLTMGASGTLNIRGTGGDITTPEIIFTSETGAEGIYYKEGTRTRLYGSETRFTALSKQYTLKHVSASNALLSDSEITTGAYVLYTTANSMNIVSEEGDFIYFNKAIFPDDGSDMIIDSVDGFLSVSLPSGIVFSGRVTGGVFALSDEERTEIETTTAERASSEGAAPETEIGCHDIDEDSSPTGTASYVSDVRAGGMSIVIPDFCAEEGSAILYEASCRDGTAIITSTECPTDQPCSRGACRSTGTITKFCIDSDRGAVDGDETTLLTQWAQTKSNTVGFYAATEGGKEFGAWNDYCRDDKTLIEYYCSDRTEAIGLFKEIICPEGCSEGVCEIPPYCFDTDGGSFENVKGSIKSVSADGTYVSQEDTCNDETTVHEYSCDSFNEVNGFKTENKACAEGKKCVNGRCTSDVPNCNECDALNPFNIKIGESCNADGTPNTFTLARCPSGTYCESTLNKCIAEPALSTEASVISALNKRKDWTNLMEDASWWLERVTGITLPKDIGESCFAPEDCASQICVSTPLSLEDLTPGDKTPIEWPKVCAERCEQNEDCVAGKICSTSAATAGQCVALIAPIGTVLAPRYDVSGYLTDIRDMSSTFRGMREAGPRSI